MNSIKFLSKIALTAGLLLALAFTFSCSDDDKGDWLTCEEARSLSDKCWNKYEADLNACKTEACEDAVYDKIDRCFMPDACHGTSDVVCDSHYRAACPDSL